MSYETERDFTWLLRALRPRGQRPGAPPQELPNIVLDSITPSFDAFGWTRYADPGIGVVNTALANTTDLNGPATPSGFLRWYFAAMVLHEDAVANHHVWLEINIPSLAQSIPVIPALSLPSTAPNAIEAPLVVRAGANIRAKAQPATGAGNNLRLRAFFLDLSRGEYVPPR